MNSTDPSCDFLLLDTIRELREQVKALEARLAEAMEALRDIAESDDIDNALDPARNKRVARRLVEKEDGR